MFPPLYVLWLISLTVLRASGQSLHSHLSICQGVPCSSPLVNEGISWCCPSPEICPPDVYSATPYRQILPPFSGPLPECFKLFDSLNATCVTSSSLLYLPLFYGNVKSAYQANVSLPLSGHFLWLALWKLHRMKWLIHYHPSLNLCPALLMMLMFTFQLQRVKLQSQLHY
jgi:hypothetical protein